MLADVSLSPIVLHALIFLFLVYCSDVLRQAPNRHQCAIRWLPHRRSVVITIHCLWPNSCEYLNLILIAFLIISVQIPQLWSSRILKHGGNSASMRRLISIAAIKEEEDRQASQWVEDQRTLAEARTQGKEAHAAAKAHIAQEREAAMQAKKIERLRATAERQAEKARVAAENKARQLERKVRGHCLQSQFHQATHDSKAAKRKATSQTVEGLPEGEQHVPPPPVNHTMMVTDDNIIDLEASNDKFSLHPDDPVNFLRLSAALQLLVCRRLTDSDIDRAEQLICKYCTELLPVSPRARV
jgi:hypothetical protein